MTVRKNFIFDEEVARHLEELAKKEGKTQTQITQEAIENLYKQIDIEKKLQALETIKDTFHGALTDVDAKKVRQESVSEKYGK